MEEQPFGLAAPQAFPLNQEAKETNNIFKTDILFHW